MNRTEERLTDAMQAYAGEITDEMLSPATPTRPPGRHRWAIRLAPVAAAAVVALITLLLPGETKNTPAPRTSSPVAGGWAAPSSPLPSSPPVVPAGPAIVYAVGGDPHGWMAGYNTVSHTLGHVIRLGRGSPVQVVIAPDRKMAYVLAAGPGSVIPVNLVTGQADRPINGLNDPQGLAIAPDGKTLYALNSHPGFVIPISTATDTAGPAIKVADWAQGVVVTPDGGTVYVSSENTYGVVTPISTATGTAGRPVHLSWASQIVFAPDGRTAYVGSGSVAGPAAVTPISTATGTAGQPVTAGSGPASIVVTPDGRTVYVGAYFSKTLTPIDAATGRPGRAIRLPIVTWSLAIAPDGRTAWAMSDIAAPEPNGRVVRVDLATGKAGRPIVAGTQPAGIEFTPDSRTAYVATDTKNLNVGVLIPINVATGAEGSPITLPGRPWATAILP